MGCWLAEGCACPLWCARLPSTRLFPRVSDECSIGREMRGAGRRHGKVGAKRGRVQPYRRVVHARDEACCKVPSTSNKAIVLHPTWAHSQQSLRCQRKNPANFIVPPLPHPHLFNLPLCAAAGQHGQHVPQRVELGVAEPRVHAAHLLVKVLPVHRCRAVPAQPARGRLAVLQPRRRASAGAAWRLGRRHAGRDCSPPPAARATEWWRCSTW